MNLRSRAPIQHPGIQLAPLVDVLLLLLIFFLLTWKADGNVVVNRRTLSGVELTELLKGLVALNSEQAVVIRGDEAGAYKNIINVLDIATQAGITNVAFATAK